MKKTLYFFVALPLFFNAGSALAAVPAEVSEQTLFMLQMGTMIAGGVLVAYFAISGLRAIRNAL